MSINGEKYRKQFRRIQSALSFIAVALGATAVGLPDWAKDDNKLGPATLDFKAGLWKGDFDVKIDDVFEVSAKCNLGFKYNSLEKDAFEVIDYKSQMDESKKRFNAARILPCIALATGLLMVALGKKYIALAVVSAISGACNLASVFLFHKLTSQKRFIVLLLALIIEDDDCSFNKNMRHLSESGESPWDLIEYSTSTSVTLVTAAGAVQVLVFVGACVFAVMEKKFFQHEETPEKGYYVEVNESQFDPSRSGYAPAYPPQGGYAPPYPPQGGYVSPYQYPPQGGHIPQYPPQGGHIPQYPPQGGYIPQCPPKGGYTIQ